MKFVDKIDIYIYLIQYSIFLMLKLFETSGIKFIKLRISINLIVSSSCMCYTITVKQKTQRLFDEFSYSFNIYIKLYI